MGTAILQSIAEDIRICHKLNFPGHPLTWRSGMLLFLNARGLFFLSVLRIYSQGIRMRSVGPVKFGLRVMMNLGIFLSRMIAKCDIGSNIVVEPGVYFSSKGHLVIGAHTIGSGTVIHDRVTIGMNWANRGIPKIGRNVWIGSRCVIYGNITIGDGATILPGTIVSRSLPADVVVQGNPPRILKRGFNNSKLRSTLSQDASILSVLKA